MEDSEDDVMLFELSLKRTGLHDSFEIIRRFPDGDEAVQYFTQPSSAVELTSPPDIIVLDIKLPGRSGFEVLAAVRCVHAQTAIAIFTSSVLEEDRTKAVDLGADIFQTKNFEPAEFSRFLHWLARIAEERQAKNL